MIFPAPDFPSSRTRDGALYLDNAATSWPKPPGVALAMRHFLDEVGANPGRSGHRQSIEAAVYRASPLPQPSAPALFERNLVVTFRPEH